MRFQPSPGGHSWEGPAWSFTRSLPRPGWSSGRSFQRSAPDSRWRSRRSPADLRTTNATFGFSDTVNLDEGAMWPTSFALKEMTATEEARIVALVKKAVS